MMDRRDCLKASLEFAALPLVPQACVADPPVHNYDAPVYGRSIVAEVLSEFTNLNRVRVEGLFQP